MHGQRRQAHAARQDLQGQLRQEAARPPEQEDEEAGLKVFLALGALLAAAAVGLGAFGAHGLKTRFPSEMLALWQTAVHYHAWHALGLLAVGLAGFHFEGNWLKAAGWLLLAGIGLFSGSLYALALAAPRVLGIVTPVGGLAFILGWLAFALAIICARRPA
jgi:uncharacterized membrane protein YgdD (TMEM256/DUF423 family)